MSNNKQSSVQQFWDKIALKLSVDQITEFLPLLEQAKEMEKQQKQFMFDCGRQYQLTGEGTFAQVYNETYGGNK